MTKQKPASFKKSMSQSYPLWKASVRAYLVLQELGKHMNGTVSVPDQADGEAWLVQKKRMITTTITTEVLIDVETRYLEIVKRLMT